MSESPEISAALARGALRRAEMLRQCGGLLSLGEAAAILRLSAEEVKGLADGGRLLSLQPDYQFPAFQFDREKGALVAGLDKVLNEFTAVPAITGWSKFTFLLAPRDSLGGATPFELLQRGQIAKVVALAGVYAC